MQKLHVLPCHRLSRILPALVVAAFLSMPALAQDPPPAEPEPAIAQTLPQFDVWDLYNQPFHSKHWIQGTPILVDFWATYCAPCRFTLPEIQKVHEDYGDRLQVVGISVDTGAGGGVRARNFAREGGVTYPIYHDLKAEARKATGVNILPVLFLYDADGKLVQDWWDEPDFDEVREAIDRVVAPKPSAEQE